jgi:cyclophilin family peptidyl-prolyl cis-trans isomerase
LPYLKKSKFRPNFCEKYLNAYLYDYKYKKVLNMLKRIALFLAVLATVPFISSFDPADMRKKVLIHTDFGDIKLVLFDETPKHRDNFLKLIQNHTLDSTLFHRVIKSFMIQGGDIDSKTAKPGQFLGNGDVGYTIPAEFHPNLFHKKGALAAARQGDDVNPAKASSGCQFYIVQGKTFREGELDTVQRMRMDQPIKQAIFTCIINDPANLELRNAFFRAQNRYNTTGNSDSLNYYSQKINPMVEEKFAATPHRILSPAQREVYKTTGGAPHLDGAYTVFGEVVEGLEVVDQIAATPVDGNARPLTDMRMTIKVIDVNPKK